MNQIKSKKIVLINQHTTYLFIDIINSFCGEYDEVVLFAGVVKPMSVALNPAVKVVPITMYNKKNIITRSLSWVAGFVKSVFLINLFYRDHDVFVTSNPPLLNFINLFCKNNVSLLVYDVYPDALAAGGFVTKSNIVYRIWAGFNKRAFIKMQSITTLTNGMAKALSAYVDAGKIAVIPAWSNQNLSGAGEVSAKNEFTAKYHLRDKFLIIYAGNLGLGYELESLVELAKNLKETDAIQIVIIGEGFKHDIIQNMIADYSLTNCHLLPYQPASSFLSMLQAMDIGVVSLEKGTSQIAIPSKTYNILGVGKPVICLGTKESDLAELIEHSHSGMSFTSDSIDEMTSFVMKLYSNRAYYDQLSKNAVDTASKFTFRNADLMVKNHLNHAVGQKNNS